MSYEVCHGLVRLGTDGNWQGVCDYYAPCAGRGRSGDHMTAVVEWNSQGAEVKVTECYRAYKPLCPKIVEAAFSFPCITHRPANRRQTARTVRVVDIQDFIIEVSYLAATQGASPQCACSECSRQWPIRSFAPQLCSVRQLGAFL